MVLWQCQRTTYRPWFFGSAKGPQRPWYFGSAKGPRTDRGSLAVPKDHRYHGALAVPRVKSFVSILILLAVGGATCAFSSSTISFLVFVRIASAVIAVLCDESFSFRFALFFIFSVHSIEYCRYMGYDCTPCKHTFRVHINSINCGWV